MYSILKNGKTKVENQTKTWVWELKFMKPWLKMLFNNSIPGAASRSRLSVRRPSAIASGSRSQATTWYLSALVTIRSQIASRTACPASLEVALTVRCQAGGTGLRPPENIGENSTEMTPGMDSRYLRPAPPFPMTRPQYSASTSIRIVVKTILCVQQFPVILNKWAGRKNEFFARIWCMFGENLIKRMRLMFSAQDEQWACT